MSVARHRTFRPGQNGGRVALLRTGRPHRARVGQVPGTEHFRNVTRLRVIISPRVLSIRIDESLYFPNARFLEDLVSEAVAVDSRMMRTLAPETVDEAAVQRSQTVGQGTAALPTSGTKRTGMMR